MENVMAWDALNWARQGDWEAVAEHIERGGKITPELRNFLASVLRSDAPKPKKRPVTLRMFRRRMRIAEFIVLARRRGAKNATQEAAIKFNMDHRAVQRIFKTYGKAVAQRIADDERAWAEAGIDPGMFEGLHAYLSGGIK
jgi:hypothetical protein